MPQLLHISKDFWNTVFRQWWIPQKLLSESLQLRLHEEDLLDPKTAVPAAIHLALSTFNRKKLAGNGSVVFVMNQVIIEKNVHGWIWSLEMEMAATVKIISVVLDGFGLENCNSGGLWGALGR